MAPTSTRVTSADTVRTCPRCGALEIAPILYGLAAFSEQLEADLAAHRIVLGGCLVWHDQPDRHCAACDLEFRADGRPAVAEPTR